MRRGAGAEWFGKVQDRLQAFEVWARRVTAMVVIGVSVNGTLVRLGISFDGRTSISWRRFGMDEVEGVGFWGASRSSPIGPPPCSTCVSCVDYREPADFWSGRGAIMTRDDEVKRSSA